MRLTKYDMADNIKTRDDALLYLQAAFEDGNPEDIINVLGALARSEGMTKLAAEIGVGRESLYKSLSKDGNPSFATIFKIIKSLGLSLKVVYG